MIAFHIKMKIPFTVQVSNYTIKFESSVDKVYFVKVERGKRAFIAFQKINRELKTIPYKVDDDFVKYYQTGFLYDMFYADKIYQIDIKSCYANILHNKNLITDETYNFICSLPKDERLACVGMVAARKNIFEFDNNGKCSKHTVDINENTDYFFYCVQETYKIMDEIKKQLGSDFLFSWVDAAYITNTKNVQRVLDYMKDAHGLHATVKELHEFEVKKHKNHFIITYIKDGEPSYINMPIPETQEQRQLINYLLTTKINDNETNKNQITRKESI